MLPLAAIPHVMAFLGAIVFGGAILLAVRILGEGRDEDADAMHHLLRGAAWLLIVGGILAILLLAGIIPGVVAIVVLPAVVLRRFRAHRHALLAAMAVAVERRIPLIPVLLAFAAERRGYIARRAIELASRLQSGLTLPDSVESVCGLFPPQTRLALRMGHDSGNLAKVLRSLLGRSDAHDQVESQISGKIMYFAILSLFMLQIVVFVMMKIVPAMQKIFEEFGMELPGMTLLLIRLCYLCVNFWYLAAPLVLMMGWFGIASGLRYVGFVEGDLWGMGWIRRRMHTAAILETIAMFVDANRPITEALAGLAHWYPAGNIRRRLAWVHHDIEQGRDWCEALARQRLISAGDSGLLMAAQRVGNLAWASLELAESNRRRCLTRASALVQTAFVVLLLGYGMLVAFFFIGNFLPLIKLISSLTSQAV